MVSIWKDWAYTAFLTVPSFTVGITMLSYPAYAIAVGGELIRPPLCCAWNACGDDLFLTFLPFSKKKGKYSHSSSHCSQKGASGEKVYVRMSALS